jgi:hypothetical protein
MVYPIVKSESCWDIGGGSNAALSANEYRTEKIGKPVSVEAANWNRLHQFI